jgi:hypothetical protein
MQKETWIKPLYSDASLKNEIICILEAMRRMDYYDLANYVSQFEWNFITDLVGVIAVAGTRFPRKAAVTYRSVVKPKINPRELLETSSSIAAGTFRFWKKGVPMNKVEVPCEMFNAARIASQLWEEEVKRLKKNGILPQAQDIDAETEAFEVFLENPDNQELFTKLWLQVPTDFCWELTHLE